MVNYLKFQILEELPDQIRSYLSNFEVKDVRIIKSVLLKGKKIFNNTNNTYYRLEDVEFELVSVLKRFKAMLLQKNETVEIMQGYLMKSINTELKELHALICLVKICLNIIFLMNNTNNLPQI